MPIKTPNSNRDDRITRARKNLQAALEDYKTGGARGDLPFLTLAKTLEVLTEYVWKDLKQRVEDQGLFAPSPKEAIRQAAVVGIISEPDVWLRIITARNDSIHDYFNIPQTDYVALAERFIALTSKLYK